MKSLIMMALVAGSVSLLTASAYAQSGSRSGGGFLGSGSRGYAPTYSSPSYTPSYGGGYSGGGYGGYSQPHYAPTYSGYGGGCSSHGMSSVRYAPSHLGSCSSSCAAPQAVHYSASGCSGSVSNSYPASGTPMHSTPQTFSPSQPAPYSSERIVTPLQQSAPAGPAPLEHEAPPIPMPAGSIGPSSPGAPTARRGETLSPRLVRSAIDIAPGHQTRVF